MLLSHIDWKVKPRINLCTARCLDHYRTRIHRENYRLQTNLKVVAILRKAVVLYHTARGTLRCWQCECNRLRLRSRNPLLGFRRLCTGASPDL